ncbi:MAG: hypothetical protein ABSG97_03960 [Sedimentisphaerales bacterium]|jgi:hypothetical protein
MIKKQSNFIDEHIEKVALVIGGLAAIYVLYAFALRGPELVFDNQKFRPGQLDIYIAEQSEQLKARMEREPIHKPPYVPQSVSFLAKMNSVLDKDLNVVWPVPSSGETMIDKKYHIPVIGSVNDVSLEHIRAAAYMPKVAVNLENVESEDTYEPNDLDLVTVQASFDLAPLIDSFQECFAGKDVPEGWRDTGLAKPVFAAVQLQRQRFGDNGEWGRWEDVPRVKIDPKRDDYKIIDDVNGLPSGGVMVQLAKLSAPQTQVKLLQPDPYKIASADDDWLPPSLHRKFLAVRREKEAQDRRETIATEREAKAAEERDKAAGRPAREVTEKPRGTTEPTGRTTTPGRPAGGAGYRGGAGGGAGRGGVEMGGGATRNLPKTTTAKPDRTSERDRRTESTTAAEQKKTAKPVVTEATIYGEMKKMQLTTGKDISKLREAVTFWAYDDTVEPGAIYRYRIRLGVFNPVAGTGQVREEDAEKDSKVILWSEFSDATDEIAIDKRLYFFPLNVQETAMAAEVQVCRYVLGYWHSEPFMVKRGDVIGRVARVEPSDKDKKNADVKLPETIDYTTGAVVVDLVAMNDWSGDKTLQSRQYFDMLFSFDGTSVERLPAKQMYWPEERRLKYSELKTLEKRPKEPWRAWGSTGPMEVQQRGLPGDGMRRGPGGLIMEDNMQRRGLPPQ